GLGRPHGPQTRIIFRLGGVQLGWAHPQLEEGVAFHGVLPNQQMKPASASGALIAEKSAGSTAINGCDRLAHLCAHSVPRGSQHRTCESDGNAALDATTFILRNRSEEHTSELQSRENLVCRL